MSYHYWSGDLIRLRAVRASDIALFDSFDDEAIRNVDAIQWPMADGRQMKWLEGEQHSKLGDVYRFVAENRQSEPVGTINTFECNRRNGTFKYGITVAADHRGQGYAKAMIVMVLRYYFHELNYQKVTPHIYSFNNASIRLHESLGFCKEGQLRNMIYTNGEYHDELHYGMTRQEFDLRYA